VKRIYPKTLDNENEEKKKKIKMCGNDTLLETMRRNVGGLCKRKMLREARMKSEDMK
jgi:hypothetical protein